MAITHAGSLLGLPDFGVTEKISDVFGRGRTSQGGSNLVGTNSGNYQVYIPPQQTPGPSYSGSPYGPTNQNTGGQVLGAKTGNSGGNTSQTTQPSPVPQVTIPSPSDNVNGSGSQLDLINSEFDNFNSYLNDQSGLANQRFNNTQSAIVSERDTAVTDAEGQRGIRTQELDQKSAQGRANERLNLQKVRQLLQDLEQRNSARTAITGGGGSVSEALADRFARTAQQNIGGVLQEGQRYQNDIETERVRTNQFYDTAVQKIKDTAQNQINEARYKLNENLSAIDSERRASAQQKATARYDAWRSYYDSVNQAKIQAANFQAQYDMWLQGRQQTLADATNFQMNPIAEQNFNSYLNGDNYAVGGQPTNNDTISYAPTKYSIGKNSDEEQNKLIGLNTPQYGLAVA